MANSIRLIVAVAMVCLFQLHSAAQSFSVNTDGSIAHPSAILDVKSTDKGILIPRMSKTDKNAITSPATGLIIYQETPDSTGFYYYNSTKWIWLSDGVNKDTTAWKITGNDNITSAHEVYSNTGYSKPARPLLQTTISDLLCFYQSVPSI